MIPLLSRFIAFFCIISVFQQQTRFLDFLFWSHQTFSLLP